MAVIHITDSSIPVADLLIHIRAGDRVVIEENTNPVAILSSAELYPPHYVQPSALPSFIPRVSGAAPHDRSLSEAIRLARERNSQVTLDDQFGNDLEDVIRLHENEVLQNPWE